MAIAWDGSSTTPAAPINGSDASVDTTGITITLPTRVTMAIVSTEPVVKGQTASSSYKPAIVESGARVMVPPHIDVGTRIVINTDDSSYVERAKD